MNILTLFKKKKNNSLMKDINKQAKIIDQLYKKNTQMKYYLSSMESMILEPVRECEYIKSIRFNTGKLAEIVKLSDSIQWKNEYGFHESQFAIISARHEGYEIENISKFPTFVYVAVLKNNEYENINSIAKEDLVVIGIGEIYETYEKAQNHIFE